jgi:hypothetical protein
MFIFIAARIQRFVLAKIGAAATSSGICFVERGSDGLGPSFIGRAWQVTETGEGVVV